MVEDVKQSLKDANFKENGQFAVGNRMSPGRPKGSKNRYTVIKEEIADLWLEEDVKESIRDLMKDKSYLKKFIKDIVIPILPKDALIDQSSTTIIQIFKNHDPNDRTNDPQVVLQQEAD